MRARSPALVYVRAASMRSAGFFGDFSSAASMRARAAGMFRAATSRAVSPVSASTDSGSIWSARSNAALAAAVSCLRSATAPASDWTAAEAGYFSSRGFSAASANAASPCARSARTSTMWVSTFAALVLHRVLGKLHAGRRLALREIQAREFGLCRRGARVDLHHFVKRGDGVGGVVLRDERGAEHVLRVSGSRVGGHRCARLHESLIRLVLAQEESRFQDEGVGVGRLLRQHLIERRKGFRRFLLGEVDGRQSNLGRRESGRICGQAVEQGRRIVRALCEEVIVREGDARCDRLRGTRCGLEVGLRFGRMSRSQIERRERAVAGQVPGSIATARFSDSSASGRRFMAQ